VIGLSTTGVAGPGPDGDKPAGLVYVGVRIPAAISPDGVPSVTAHELHLTGGREEVRRSAVFSLVQIVSHFTGDMQE
uniref:CinA family protein n=1 Tax=Bifidobacterium bifidum TaxID=1681 RepID=UPI0034A28786